MPADRDDRLPEGIEEAMREAHREDPDCHGECFEPTDVYQGQRHSGDRTHFVGDDCPRVPTAAMTGGGGGDLREALRRVDEACPCRLPNVKEIINACRGWCDCSIGKEQGASCLWPGHAAARDLARVAAEWGFDHTIGYGYPRPMARKALDAILEGRDDEA